MFCNAKKKVIDEMSFYVGSGEQKIPIYCWVKAETNQWFVIRYKQDFLWNFSLYSSSSFCNDFKINGSWQLKNISLAYTVFINHNAKAVRCFVVEHMILCFLSELANCIRNESANRQTNIEIIKWLHQNENRVT